MFRLITKFLLATALLASCAKPNRAPNPSDGPATFCATVLDAETGEPVQGVMVDVGITGYIFPDHLHSDSLGKCCTSKTFYKDDHVTGITLSRYWYMPEFYEYNAQNKPPTTFRIYRGKYVKLRLVNLMPATPKDFMWVCCPPFLTGFWGKPDTTFKFMVYPNVTRVYFDSTRGHSDTGPHMDTLMVSFATSDTASILYKY